MLSKRLRVSILAVGALGIIAAVVAVSGYMASRQVPAFYSEALHQAPDKAAAESDTLLANASALMNTARKPGQWEATFTADQINGWLTVDVPKNFPNLLPPTVT